MFTGVILVSERIQSYADGEAVIMLAFQASGRGSTPLRRRVLFFMLVSSVVWTQADPSDFDMLR